MVRGVCRIVAGSGGLKPSKEEEDPGKQTKGETVRRGGQGPDNDSGSVEGRPDPKFTESLCKRNLQE